MACLYLGGKVEDSPKSVRDVLIASCELRYRDQARRLSQDRVSSRGTRQRADRAHQRGSARRWGSAVL